MLIYLDTSAALKLLIEEAESHALTTYLDNFDNSCTLISSMLLYTELHCASKRRLSGTNTTAVDQLLAHVNLLDVERADLWRSARSGWGLRSADAIHLATALRVETDVLLAYGTELLAAAADNDLSTTAPTG